MKDVLLASGRTPTGNAEDSTDRIGNRFAKAVPNLGIHKILSQIGIHLDQTAKIIPAMQVARSDRRVTEELRLAADVPDHVQSRTRDFSHRSYLDLGVISRQDHLGSFLSHNATEVRMADMMGMDITDGSREVAFCND